MVSVFATVRDKHGNLVPALTEDDFVLSQDGQPQAISYFDREKDVALTAGLLVDTSRSQTSVLGDERTASYSFLDHILRDDKDRAFLIHFDHEVELLQDLTSSRQKLQSALNLLNTPELERASDDSNGGGQRQYRGGGTLLCDAVYLASTELMQKQQGLKALVILSDGVDRGSKESLTSAIEAAQRANTVVYSILFKGEEPYGYGNHGGWGGGMGGHGGGHRRYPQEERPDGKKVLERISKETGGRLFEVSKKQTVDDIYTQIAGELRNQYILGYAPPKDQSGPGYHKIQLTAKQKDLVVQAREGYYGSP
jgi:VWFA-related protein